jgi:hypothetical protein
MYLQLSNDLEVRMLKKEDYLMIEVLHERGVYQKDIAEELGVHPRTVRRALKRGMGRKMLLDLGANNDRLVHGDRPPVSNFLVCIQISLSLLSFVFALTRQRVTISGEI